MKHLYFAIAMAIAACVFASMGWKMVACIAVIAIPVVLIHAIFQ